MDLPAGEFLGDIGPNLGEEVDGELGGGHGDSGTELAAAVGDAGQPVGEHTSGDGRDFLARGSEQVILSSGLLDDQGLTTDLLKDAVEGIELFAHRGVLTIQQSRYMQRRSGLSDSEQGAAKPSRRQPYCKACSAPPS